MCWKGRKPQCRKSKGFKKLLHTEDISPTKLILPEVRVSVARSALGAIPYAGQLLNEVVFEYRGRVKQERFNRFIDELAKYMASFDETDFKFDYIKSDDFGDIFESIIKRVIYNRSEDKMHRFKKILVKQMIAPSYSDYTETFLDLVGRLNEKQIEILSVYKDVNDNEVQVDDSILQPGRIDEPHENKLSDFRTSGYYNIEKETYEFYVQDLVSKALLIDDGMNRYGTRPMEILKITSFGIAFLRFIEEA